MSKSISLGKDSIGKLFLNFSIPAVTGMLVTAFYAIIDGVFIGQGVGADGLAAINIGYPIVNFGAALSLMFGVGGSTLISLYPKNKKIQNRCFSYIITLNIISYIFIVLMVIIFNEKLLYLMGSSEQLLPMVKAYLYPCTVGVGFLMLANSLNAVVRNDKSPTYAFIAMVIGAVTNIILDWLFIIVFRWGMFGGALATAIGQLFSMLFLIKYFFRFGCHFKYKFMKLKLNILYKMLMIGFPSFIMEFAVALITILFNLSFMKYSGELGVSAFCIVGYIFYIFRMLFSGLGQGIQPIVSYNYGAKLNDRVKGIYKLGHRVSLVISTLILIWVVFFSKSLIVLFNNDIVLREKASEGMILYTSAIIFMGANFINIAYLQSKGKANSANLLSILRSTVYVAITLFILPKIIGERGVWLALPVSDLLTYLTTVVLQKRGML
ncbi:MATE family efflux transporter [Fusobacterium sp. SYSU M8D902]|uniref:MATE family efflux transporter n=1 Tax=Fusobacterium sp. SYSU M8D902 TaxID=3159562 RepID=UPI0032E38006